MFNGLFPRRAHQISYSLFFYAARAARFLKHTMSNTKGWLRLEEVKIESHVFAQGLIVVDAQRAHTRGKIAPRRVIFGLITIYREARFS